MSSPSVFNFFLPDFQPIGKIANANLVAPEFAILNSNSSIGFLNQTDDWLFDDKLMDINVVFGSTIADDSKVRLDVDDELAIANDTDKLLDRLDLILTHGDLSDNTRSIIKNYIDNNLSTAQEKVGYAIYLIMLSPDYVILR